MRTRLLATCCFALAIASFVRGTANAALTTGNCLAQKLNAAGNFQKCRAAANAKLLQGKAAAVATCTTKFQDKLAKISGKASKVGIGCRYGDNGDGTVTDYDTGLQWEQKNGAGAGADLANPHDVDNTYTWKTGVPTTPNGTAFTDFLGELNDCTAGTGINLAGFALHCDWRLPTLVELQTILLEPDPCGTSPCIDPIFGPSDATFYWSSTTNGPNPLTAWLVHFGTGSVAAGLKGNSQNVRAVRGGW